jgi:hypothetical protein
MLEALVIFNLNWGHQVKPVRWLVDYFEEAVKVWLLGT